MLWETGIDHSTTECCRHRVSETVPHSVVAVGSQRQNDARKVPKQINLNEKEAQFRISHYDSGNTIYIPPVMTFYILSC